GNLFFSWEVGSGLEFHGVASFLTLLIPFNIVFFFIKRSWIEPFMTFFVWMKFLAMGFSMCFFLSNYWKKSGQKLDNLWIVIGSAGYALSAYSVQYYLLPWLDIAAMFPLLIYALLRMIEYEPCRQIKKYSASYLFLMTLIFFAHIPQAYMVCFYLILFAGSYFFLARHTTDEKERNKAAILKFGLLTLLALAFSAVVFIPAAISIMQSGRISSVDYSYFHLLDEPGMDPSCKRLMLYSVLVPLIYLIVTFRKSMLKTHLSECVVICFMILPVFVEGTNILWHMGPYICFPMRFGYMMIFTIIAAAAKRMIERKEEKSSNTTSRLTFKRKWEYGAVAFWFLTILTLSVWLIRAGRPGEDDPFVSDCEEVSQILPTDSDIFHKTKLADASLSHNYTMITRTCAFSNYVHLIPQAAMDFSKELGYAQNHTILSDTGGTLFSDAVLGYTCTFKSTIPN
ncbi:MAG: YfhO family protein, partial [Lachnospiraceae bacterium]|nr:YfhO family protein [Lachnospiraceae bacterium]